MRPVAIQIRFPRGAGSAELEVVTPPSVDPTATLARLLPSMGVKPWYPFAVRTLRGQITHVGVSEPDGSRLAPERASEVVGAVRAALGGAASTQRPG
jgi:hypothetical protein